MSKTLKNEKIININGQDLTVRKLPIRKVMNLLESIGKLPSELANIDKVNADEVVENMPLLMATSLPLFADVIVKALEDQVTKDWLLDECGFDDAMEIIEVIIEVNNIAGILERIKKVQALTKKA